ERHEEHVERIDEELLVEGRDRSAGHDPGREPCGDAEGGEAEGGIDLRRAVALAVEPQERAADERDREEEGEDLHHSSFSCSRWCMSSESNCSRIWNRNTPRITMPTSTSSAIPSSTTIGMP